MILLPFSLQMFPIVATGFRPKPSLFVEKRDHFLPCGKSFLN